MKIYDIVIKDGKIIDGTGNPWFKTDIGIIGDSIKKIGKILKKNARKIIDASKLYISPGFIDIHSHSDFTIMPYPNSESSIMQGITTSVVGNCGWTLAPMNKKNCQLLKDYFSPSLRSNFNYGWDWQSLKEFYQKIQKKGLSINLVPLVGQGTIRMAVKGFDNSKCKNNEILEMKSLLKKSLEDGVFGLSLGLGYPPGGYSTIEELIELTKVLKDYNSILSSHIRDYGNNLLDSLKEIIKIGEENMIPIIISHLVVKGKNNWNLLTTKALDVLKEARDAGIEIYCDRYPYIAGCSTITQLLPLWALEGGIQKMLNRLKNKEQREMIKKDIIKNRIEEDNGIQEVDLSKIVISDCQKNQTYEGKTLKEIISVKGRLNEAYDCLMDIIFELKGECTQIKYFSSEEDIKEVIINPIAMVGSDGEGINPSARGKPHPRSYGTFPRFLKQYVKQYNLLTWENAIRKITSMPASVIRLKSRGLIKENFKADIVIINPETIEDTATFEEPHQYAKGIEYVIINGISVLEKGKFFKSNSGKVLFKNN